MYGFNVPDNMYLWGALKRLQQLNAVVWRDEEIAATTVQLMRDVHEGIVTHGVVEVAPGVRTYAYEVRTLQVAGCAVSGRSASAVWGSPERNA
jgi:meiotically up-regulated gene 157 (Mug157) protein